MTDYDDFKKFSGRAAASPERDPHVGRTLTVGLRSDGQVSVISDEGKPGVSAASVFIMDRPTARWLANELLRCATESPPSSEKR